VQDAVTVQHRVRAVLDLGARASQRHTIAHPLTNLPHFRGGQITLREGSAKPKTGQPVGVGTVAFGFVLGEHFEGGRMTEIRIESQFGEQVGHPGPAEGSFQSHRCAGRQLRQPGTHGLAVGVFQPRPLDHAEFAWSVLFNLRHCAKPAMQIPTKCGANKHGYLRWSVNRGLVISRIYAPAR